MSRAASYSSISGQPRTFAIAGSLLLVSVSYVLLLSAPIITRHLRSVVSGVGGVRAFEWLPLACGAGLVLGGASALVFVLTQIAREAERRPYVCMAPVLAAFSACILIGLRADLPLKGVASEQVAVFGLALSVIGGSLVQTSRTSAQMLGVGFAFLPPVSLFVVLWIVSGKIDPARVVWSLSAPARAFVGMLTLSSFAIAAVATLGRRGEPSLSPARLPRDQQGYVLYELEEDLMADEARLRQRGLPGWAIVLASAAAVALGFMALKVFLERRPALNFLAPTSEAATTAAKVAPEAAAVPAGAAAPLVEQVAPAAGEPAPSAQDSAQTLPALNLRAGDAPAQAAKPSAPAAKALPEQPVREPIAPAAAAPELARKAAALAVKPPRSHARNERRAVRAAPAVRAEKPVAAPAPRAEKAAPAAPAKVAEAAPKEVAPKVEAKKKPQSVGDLALQAAAIVSENAQKQQKPGSASKPVPHDDSLDALMDNALNKPEKGGKKQRANEDPIYGL